MECLIKYPLSNSSNNVGKKLMLSLMTETVNGTMTVVESPSMSFKLKEQDSNEMK